MSGSRFSVWGGVGLRACDRLLGFRVCMVGGIRDLDLNKPYTLSLRLRI